MRMSRQELERIRFQNDYGLRKVVLKPLLENAKNNRKTKEVGYVWGCGNSLM